PPPPRRRAARASPPATPVEGSSLLMPDREDADVVGAYSIENAVREAPHEPPANVPVNGLAGERGGSKGLDGALHLCQERIAEPGTGLGVVRSSLVQLVLGELVKDDRERHLRRARASRKTASAGRPRDGSASSSASRRRASSVHRRRTSSS